MKLIWRGFHGGYPAPQWLHCWRLDRWTAQGRRHYGFGPVVLSRRLEQDQ